MYFKVTRSEFNQFNAQFNAQPRNPHLRYGQAWYNHFKLHNHTPVSKAERSLLDLIYNETDKGIALNLIKAYFIGERN